jgi:alkylated DNA repair dioxygenase AlkB
MPDAEVLFYPALFDAAESAYFLDRLTQHIAWEQQNIKIFGKPVPVPRLVAWYGDARKSYSYSGVTMQPLDWTDDLVQIKQRAEAAAGTTFNSVLLNRYRDESDSMGWHSDDEHELGANPVIASVSFGAARSFQFKHKQHAELRQAITLTSGSLLLMRSTTQHYWKHRLPKSKQSYGPRLNLTFRTIL